MADLSRLKYELDSSRYIADPMIRLISEHTESYATDILVTLKYLIEHSPNVFFWHIREAGDQCVVWSDLVSGWYGEYLKDNIHSIEKNSLKHQFWVIVTTRTITQNQTPAGLHGSLTQVSITTLRMLLDLDPRG